MEQQKLTFVSFEEFILAFREKYVSGDNKELKPQILKDNTRTICRTWLQLRFEIENHQVLQIRTSLGTLMKSLFTIIEEIITTREAKLNLYRDLEQILFFPQYTLASKQEQHLLFGREYLLVDNMIEEALLGDHNTLRYPSNHRTTLRNTYPQIFQALVGIALDIQIAPLVLLEDTLSEDK